MNNTHFLDLYLTVKNFNPQFVENITLIIFLLSFALTTWLNIRDWKSKH